jgi:hypothetical protein
MVVSQVRGTVVSLLPLLLPLPSFADLRAVKQHDNLLVQFARFQVGQRQRRIENNDDTMISTINLSPAERTSRSIQSTSRRITNNRQLERWD